MTEQNERDPDNQARTWTFRGYELDPANFTTAMVHFYRGEMGRANTWRTRLDATTNWAVITVAAALTFVFGEPLNPHFVFLLVLLLVLTFLVIEARRYRYYALWAYRVHLMETDFFAAIFTPPFRPSSDWANQLAESLLRATFPVAWWEAVGRRFRRNYFWLVTLLLVSWGLKLTLHPTRTASVSQVIERAAIGTVPGSKVVAAVGLVYGALLIMAVAVSLPRAWREAASRPLRWVRKRLRWEVSRPVLQPRAQERLATIITESGEPMAARILGELGRGVTALEGTGMYTGEDKDVLLCAVTRVQVPHLEEIVRQVDPEAFVIVSSAEEVRGGGFRPFEPPS